MTNHKATLVLIDGHALAYRAYFGMPASFNTSQGEATHAVYGFTNMILAVWKEYDPDYFIVTSDRGDTFRHRMYKDYKANRPPMPEDLVCQIPYIRDAVKAYNITFLEEAGFEADDLIASAARRLAKDGHEVVIVSGDKDLMLVG